MATLDVLSAAEAAAAVDVPGQSAPKLAAVVTAVSKRLDELVGPIVVRTLTNESHPGPEGRTKIELRRFPVSSVSSVTDYDVGGSPTVLTLETASSKPSSGFRLRPTVAEPELGLSGPWLERRASGRCYAFGTDVVVTYVAGRYANTAAVDERYKEAARITLANLWQRVSPGLGKLDEYDVPRFPFPTFDVPNSAKGLLLDVWQERAGSLGIA